MAQIFIFNATGSALRLFVNGGAAAGMAGTGHGYAPTGTASGLGRTAEPGRFGSGLNRLNLATEAGDTRSLAIEIPRDPPPYMDLQLYLFSRHAMLIAGAEEWVFEMQS